MGLIGKIVGGTIGFAMGGPLGAIAGAAFGHAYDASKKYDYTGKKTPISYSEQSQVTFFVATFSMLAKLARADSHVSQEEIDSIDHFMAHDLNLNPESKRIAMNIFHTALESEESFYDFAAQFYNQFVSQPQLLEMMIDILLRVSVADGVLSQSEEALVLSAVRIFNFDHARYMKLRSKYVKDADKFYAILGCDRNDSNEHIKKQYRKLVSDYHPDKIASKGLPEEFIKFANDKFREIQEAYEGVRNERRMK